MTIDRAHRRGSARFVSRVAAQWEGEDAWNVVDGTLCFVDIAGFTHLSERLARRGRIGAEELTEVLNRAFGAMLGIAHERGGSLLKFGGDALLLLFVGADRVAQACSAAVEMRAPLREAARISSSVGRVQLRMSTGLHDGPVHLFMVGDSHRELIISGPAATIATEMERAADAGDIVVSAEVAAALPAGSVGAPKGPGLMLRWRVPRVVPCGPSGPAHDTASSDKLLPVGLREYLQSGEVEGEHRSTTVGFVRFTGVDELLQSSGPAVVADALDELIATVQRAVDAELVTLLATDLDANGGKVILTAGVPIARHDDEGRLLRAARAIIDARPRLPISIGVSRGHVFVGEIGTPFRATYTVMGDNVNLAARLMGAAPPGQLYASPSVLDLSRTRFETRGLEPFLVKGRSEPVHAFAVGSATGVQRSSVGSSLPFRGRDYELALLKSACASDADRRVWVVKGDAGIGKSRLVSEAITTIRPPHRLTIRGEPYASATAYLAFRDPVRDLLGITPADPSILVDRISRIASDLIEYAPLIGDVTHLTVPSTGSVDAIDPQFRRDRVADVLIEVLGRTLPQPFVFVVDDAHWLDDASAHLLERVAAACRTRPWSMITSRAFDDGGFEPSKCDTLTLGPLAESTIRALVADGTAAASLRPHEIDAVVQRVGGNPLFLDEALRSVRASGVIDQLPETVEAVVGRQIDSLSPLSRRVLRIAAVLGRSFRADLVALVLADDDLVLSPATQTELREFIDLDTEGTFRFRHGIVRDVAYEGLPYRRRQYLHLRAGEAAERLAYDDVEAEVEVLSLHFALGGDATRTWKYACAAAEKAKLRYANVEAATHYTRALNAARGVGDVTEAERAALWTELGDAHERAGDFGAAFDAYRHAFQFRRDDKCGLAEVLLKQARTRERAGAFGAALRSVNRGIKLLETLDTSEARKKHARLAAFAATVRWGQERSRDALQCAELAITMSRAADERQALAQALIIADLADFALQGRGVGERLREALDIFVEVGDIPREGQARGNLGVIAATQSRWDEALEWFSSARAAFDRCGDTVGSAITDLNLGEILVNQFHADEAETMLVSAARALRSVGQPDGAAYAELVLARAWCACARYDDAEELLERVGAEFVGLGMAASTLDVALARAEVFVRRGNATAALELLARSEREAGREAEQFGPRLALVRAAATAAAGDPERAGDVIEQGLVAARARGMAYEEALLLLLADDIGVGGSWSLAPRSRQVAETTLTGLGVELRNRP